MTASKSATETNVKTIISKQCSFLIVDVQNAPHSYAMRGVFADDEFENGIDYDRR
ncbi:hypothetical protein [uncultured Gimesia sp.]|uniref:hypothetical protein n=1 Tax=uncultured Gimesia sp. TaxID=1678688 RepID=UPI002630CD84|nr:hypothetical protein [uncultured Gimesia sp.]